MFPQVRKVGMILSTELPFGHIKESSYLIFSKPTIVAQIETEQHLANANKESIRIFGEKIKAVINRVWGETA